MCPDPSPEQVALLDQVIEEALLQEAREKEKQKKLEEWRQTLAQLYDLELDLGN